MPPKTRDELKAGIFIIAVLALVVGLILWLGVASLFTTKGQQVAFYLPDTSPGAGIQKGSEVVIAGQKIGMVNSVNFDPANQRTVYVARLTDKSIKVYADGKAQAATALVGTAQVAITDRGTPDAPLADAKNPILVTGGIQQAINDLSATLTTLKVTLDRELNEDDPASMISELHGITGNLAKAAEDVAVITHTFRGEMDRGNPDTLLAKTHTIMSDLQTLGPKLNSTTDQLSAALTGVQLMIDAINTGEGSLGMLLNDPRLYKDLTGAAGQLKLLLEEMRTSLEVWKEKGIPMQLK
jgi:phospholipid/cholesterol/gamma-HCH transport system substrate-binding protein